MSVWEIVFLITGISIGVAAGVWFWFEIDKTQNRIKKRNSFKVGSNKLQNKSDN